MLPNMKDDDLYICIQTPSHCALIDGLLPMVGASPVAKKAVSVTYTWNSMKSVHTDTQSNNCVHALALAQMHCR